MRNIRVSRETIAELLGKEAERAETEARQAVDAAVAMLAGNLGDSGLAGLRRAVVCLEEARTIRTEMIDLPVEAFVTESPAPAVATTQDVCADPTPPKAARARTPKTAPDATAPAPASPPAASDPTPAPPVQAPAAAPPPAARPPSQPPLVQAAPAAPQARSTGHVERPAPAGQETVCAICGKSVTHGISTFVNGKTGLRHAACPPFGAPPAVADGPPEHDGQEPPDEFWPDSERAGGA